MSSEKALHQLRALANAPDAPKHFCEIVLELLDKIESYYNETAPPEGTLFSIGISVFCSCIMYELSNKEEITEHDLRRLLSLAHGQIDELILNQLTPK